MINLCVRESGLGEFGKRMWQSYEDWGELTYNADIKAQKCEIYCHIRRTERWVENLGFEEEQRRKYEWKETQSLGRWNRLWCGLRISLLLPRKF